VTAMRTVFRGGIADRVGTIRPGLLADLVVADCDPCDFAKLSTSIEPVRQSGTRVDGVR
jgi:imidazolonepropionase-like amidohydrolase